MQGVWLFCFLLALSLGNWAMAEQIIIESAQTKLSVDVRLAARVPGTLEHISVREGSSVVVGQEIARQELDLAELKRAAAQVESKIAMLQSTDDVDLRYAQKTFQVAQEEYDRTLNADSRYPGSISKTEISRLRLQAEQAKLAIEQAERDQRLATLNKDLKSQGLTMATVEAGRHTLNSKVRGLVVEVFAHPGEWLNPGDPIVRVINLDQLRIEALADANKFGDGFREKSAEFQAQIPGQKSPATFQGKIAFVSPEINPVTGETRILLLVDNPDHRLRPGMTGRIVISK